MGDSEKQVQSFYEKLSVIPGLNMLFSQVHFFEAAQEWTEEQLRNSVNLSFFDLEGNEDVEEEFKDKLITL
jgi:hypothetical protein